MKSLERPNDLAIAGGEPAFAEPLVVGRPNLPNRDRFLERVGRILDSRTLTNNGPFVQDFERQLAELLQVPYVIAVSNATIGLEIAARALGLEGEVILPSFTFVATAHALEWQHITPVFCDVDAQTHNLDPLRVEDLITSRTSAILGVHLWGRACDVPALESLAQRRGLALLFDAAHALGSTRGGRRIGGFGQAEVFSFHATKAVNAFEGGAVTTRDGALAERLRSLRAFGAGPQGEPAALGINGKMSEISAAMGLTALESFPELIAVNRRNLNAYRDALDGVPGVDLIRFDPAEEHNFQYVVVEVDEDRSGLSREALLRILEAENVFPRRYFSPGCHRSEPYCSRDPRAVERLPVTEALSRRTMALPTGTCVSPAQISVIGRIVRLAVAYGRELAPGRDRPGLALAPAGR